MDLWVPGGSPRRRVGHCRGGLSQVQQSAEVVGRFPVAGGRRGASVGFWPVGAVSAFGAGAFGVLRGLWR